MYGKEARVITRWSILLGDKKKNFTMLIISSASLLIFVIVLYNYRNTMIVKKAAYESTLLYNELVQNEWWHEIKPYSIILGGLPLETKNHSLAISHLGVKSVLSVVEAFEQEPGLRHVPVSQDRWAVLNINTKRVEARDFNPLTQNQLKEGVAFLEEQLKQGHKVYIHCKAGRGRSASVVLAYLMKTYGFSFDEAFEEVFSQRPYIKIGDYQKEAIVDFISNLDNFSSRLVIKIEKLYGTLPEQRE